MSGPTIRVASTAADAAAIAAANVAMALETEGRTLELETVTRGAQTLIASPNKGFYLVAEVDGAFAGCLMVTSEWSDWNNGDYWWFQSVYVMPAFRKQKIFSAMFKHVEQLARSAGNVASLRLYAEHDNATAKATYTHLGMQLTHYDVFEKVLNMYPQERNS